MDISVYEDMSVCLIPSYAVGGFISSTFFASAIHKLEYVHYLPSPSPSLF